MKQLMYTPPLKQHYQSWYYCHPHCTDDKLRHVKHPCEVRHLKNGIGMHTQGVWLQELINLASMIYVLALKEYYLKRYSQ